MSLLPLPSGSCLSIKLCERFQPGFIKLLYVEISKNRIKDHSNMNTVTPHLVLVSFMLLIMIKRHTQTCYTIFSITYLPFSFPTPSFLSLSLSLSTPPPLSLSRSPSHRFPQTCKLTWQEKSVVVKSGLGDVALVFLPSQSARSGSGEDEGAWEWKN